MNTPYRQKSVAVIYGGKGKERDISLKSGEYILSLLAHLDYKIIPVIITKTGEWTLGDGIICYPVRKHGRGCLSTGDGDVTVDVAIPCLHGDYGEDGRVQGALDTAAIRYIGQDTVTGAVATDKRYTKAVAESLGIPVATWVSIPDSLSEGDAQGLAEQRLDYPMFLKPSRLGSSIGAMPVTDRRAFADALRQARESSRGGVIVEELVKNKRELEIAYFSTRERAIISRPGEILTSGFYDYDSKYAPLTHAGAITDADIDTREAELLREYSHRLIDELNLRHLSRIDFFLSGDRIIFNEVNTFPGFTPSSLYPRMIAREGIEPSELIRLLIEDALSG